jgi:hypothetical protein
LGADLMSKFTPYKHFPVFALGQSREIVTR